MNIFFKYCIIKNYGSGSNKIFYVTSCSKILKTNIVLNIVRIVNIMYICAKQKLMHITVDMIFRKEYIKCFVQTLSISNHLGIIEFQPNHKLNTIVRAFLSRPYQNYRPMFGKEVTKLVIHQNNGQMRGLLILPKGQWKNLEEEFNTIFFKLFFDIESSGSFSENKRKELRIKFLDSFGITDDVMTEDSFRKKYDRFCQKMNKKAITLLNNTRFTRECIYKSIS